MEINHEDTLKPITIARAKKLLLDKPNRCFYLCPIKMQIIDSVDSYIIVGYHIYTKKYKGFLEVKGQRIWDYVAY